MDINEILGRYSSRIVGGFVGTYLAIVAYPTMAWVFVTLYAVFIAGYIISKKFGINGNGKPVVVLPRPFPQRELHSVTEPNYTKEGGVT